ncbi:MAG: uracil-DNA glycosylase [Anaerolineaceae bacterium]|nr:uracil-DNA glycosylase [Anaerolineaceae bacterium]
MTIPQFTHQLAAASPPQNCVNPYEYERPFTAARRHNLQTYLELMVQQQPKLLLVAEAPGYRGCRLTGIPFASPHILAGLGKRLQQTTDPFQPAAEWPHIQREASATIVWRTVGSWQPFPLLWNVFPFHPHQPGKPQSNRTPISGEIELGRPFLTHLHHLFPRTKLVAVGKKAANALAKWEMAFTAVRHPSHGGAKQFQAALQKLNAA